MPERAGAILPPGATIGILGGGQLGRMLALAAARLGFRTHIYCPDPSSPAFQVSNRRTEAAYDDESALIRFAKSVDVVTYEFENVPADTGGLLMRHVTVEPEPRILDITQDRYTEKSFVRAKGLNVADFEPVSSPEEIAGAARRLSYPCVLKTRRMGYDGKGQERIADPSRIEAAWASIGARPAILESFVAFDREISVIVARGRDGALQCFDIPENRHENHILRTSTVPARISSLAAAQARDMGASLAEAFRYVGVMAVEMFVTGGERLLVNEIAPRVHNSGHWTEDACYLSQFDLHIRAVAGWPLPAPIRHSDVEMTNLLGEDASRSLELAHEPASVLHLYGKEEARPGRKMGHLNRLKPMSGR
jgi:5-(carboxyamino)imidazole ribonucleotide synthase